VNTRGDGLSPYQIINRAIFIVCLGGVDHGSCCVAFRRDAVTRRSSTDLCLWSPALCRVLFARAPVFGLCFFVSVKMLPFTAAISFEHRGPRAS